ncbi:KpsF/GutQ family sugar-phosphate isomerase [Aurantimonas sp. MSK8Z-1]|uniref:KpsF/GutQ family sugar-phosphate isomerase n=1 Tax=Mangrovibrevibacter kandeliae TaxID=2968473 RepID=UPI002118D492|nr:KpsF/GutQ family sugar-phosphate isomerase [Aurantimonas sp. MSK8Z-1]MCW4116210.1 KpsF/GutQ family sugar-phosphate isomerase [Aurantimonas sp. MSK8Z-1]
MQRLPVPAQDAHAGVASAIRTIEMEAAGLHALAEALTGSMGDAFEAVLAVIAATTGRVIITGVGKSGHIGSKLAATFASTGTPAFFVHPSEANHGDLGMIGRDDVVLAMSWSGETTELKGIVSYTRRFNIPLVAITSRDTSTLARESDFRLVLPRAAEACPHGLAPTTSTAVQLAIGDALAVALLERRGFSVGDFRVFHPGGQLGASLTHVGDIMHRGERMPLVPPTMSIPDALAVMSSKGFGCVIAVEDDRLVGIFTDGDLRRHLGPNVLNRTVGELMTPKPRVIEPEMLAGKALELLNSAKINVLVVARDRQPVGIVHMHDFVRIGVA